MTAEPAAAPRGVGAKILGVVMVIVGGLDMMLFWRNGEAPSGFYILIIIAGLLVYAIGAVRAGSASQPRRKLGVTHEQGS